MRRHRAGSALIGGALGVELQDRLLTIRGEKRARSRSRQKGDEGGSHGDSDNGSRRRRYSRWAERSFGRFTRSFTLPADADTERLSASFADGVLSLEIPKSEASKPRTIDVKTR